MRKFGTFFRATRYIKHFNGDTEIDYPLAQTRPFKSMTVDKWAKNIDLNRFGEATVEVPSPTIFGTVVQNQ